MQIINLFLGSVKNKQKCVLSADIQFLNIVNKKIKFLLF